jgi:RNA polymerase sigma-70 factor, ECF subfamily
LVELVCLIDKRRMVEVRDEEEEWIARSRNGDQQAFEALVLRYQKMIFALAYRMTGSSAEAEDIVQETFIAAFREMNSFRAEAKFSSWLYRIATNRCLNWRDRDVRRGRAYEGWSFERDTNTEVVSESDDATKVHAALLKLEHKQRAAILLTAFEGMNHAEAARVLGCSEATVSWRVFMARKKLKKSLAPLMGGPRE